MAYITAQDLTDRIGEDELIVLSDREGTGEVNTSVVNQAIQDATDEINMHLACRYRLPLATVPDTLKRLTVNLAVYWLSDSDGGVSELVKDRYQNSIKTLKALAAGSMTLGLPELEQPDENSAGSVQVVGPGRQTNRKNLGGIL